MKAKFTKLTALLLVLAMFCAFTPVTARAESEMPETTPTFNMANAMLQVGYSIDCNASNHTGCTSGMIVPAFVSYCTAGAVAETESGYQVTVTVNCASILSACNQNGETHNETPEEQTITFSSEDGINWTASTTRITIQVTSNDSDNSQQPPTDDEPTEITHEIAASHTSVNIGEDGKTPAHYPLLAGSYTVAQNDADATITIQAQAYIDAYSQEKEKTYKLAQGSALSQTVTMRWTGKSWAVLGGSAVAFTVEEDTTQVQIPEKPEKPGFLDVQKITITGTCPTADHKVHNNAAYNASPYAILVTEPVWNTAKGVWESTLTLSAQDALNSYNNGIQAGHKSFPGAHGYTHAIKTPDQTITFTYNAATKTWTADKKTVQFEFDCTITTKPEAKYFDYISVTVHCKEEDTDLATGKKLAEYSYTLGDIEWNDTDSFWHCKVFLDKDQFETAYPGHTVDSTENPHVDCYLSHNWTPVSREGITVMLTENPQTYTVTFNMNAPAGKNVDQVNAMTGLTQGATVTVGTPVCDGYTLVGWTADISGVTVDENNQFIMPASDVTLTAQWQSQSASVYTVTYDKGNADNSVTVPSAASYAAGATVTVAAAPSWAGHDFAGWKLDETNTYSAGASFTMPARNVILTAQWNPVEYTYTLNYDTQGGSAVTSQTDKTTAVTKAFTITSTKPTKVGFQFMGWAETANATEAMTAATVTLTAPDNTTKTLYAVWAKEYTYTLTYDANKGIGGPGVITYKGTETSHDFGIIKDDLPTRRGFKFMGWALTSDAKEPINDDAAFIRVSAEHPNATLFAVWKAVVKTPYTYGGKLLQTGQLNWPIPVLTVGGFSLLAVGLYLVLRKKKGYYEA